MGAVGDDEHVTPEKLAAGGDSDPGATRTLNANTNTADYSPRVLRSDSSAALSVLEGDVLAGRYRILRLLGRGGMGEVYQAEDLELRGKLALKTILPNIAAQPGVLERFKREVHLARKVTHPNVCRIFDLGCHTDETGAKLWFLTMEFLAGETLLDRIVRARRLTAEEALPIVAQMAAGLQAAHAEGIVHRDFKSSNVMLLPAKEAATDSPPGVDSSSEWKVKITDFGLAHAVASTETRFSMMTGSGAVVGTPAYMAPEQVEGDEVTAQADIYALGVVIYEMVTGALPFSASTPWGAAIKRLKGPPPMPRERAPDLPPRWQAAILRCLALQPGDRFASAAEVTIALEGGRTSKRKPAPADGKNARLRRWAATGAVAAIVLALAVFVGLHRQPAVSSSPAEQMGWNFMSLPEDSPLPNITVAAASPGSTEVSLFGPSILRTWEPAEKVLPSLQSGLVPAGSAQCGFGLWLIHDDHRHLTNWDIDKHRALKTIALPWEFHFAACLDQDQSQWIFLNQGRSSAELVKYDLAAARTLRSLKLPESEYRSMALDPAGAHLALVGTNQFTELFLSDFHTEFEDRLPEQLLGKTPMRWSGSGRYVAFGFKQLTVYDLQARLRAYILPLAGWLSDVGWVGDYGLTAMDDRGRLYWTTKPAEGWQLRQEPPQKTEFQGMFWIPQQWRWLAFNGRGQAFSRQFATPALFEIPVTSYEIWSIAANPAGSLIAVAGKDPRIYLLDMGRRQVVRTLEGHTDGVTYVRFYAPNRLLSAGDDKTLRQWDTDTGKLLNTVTAHENLINAFAITPDGKWVVTVSSDGKIKAWQMPGLQPAGELGATGHDGAAAAFLPGDNQQLLISDWGGKLFLYQGTPPHWKLRAQFQIGDKEIYMACPGHNAWWATIWRGSKPGLWQVPANNLEGSQRLSLDPAYYCYTAEDGRVTAVDFADRVELRSNTDGSTLASDYYAVESGNAIAIQKQPPMLLLGLDNGHLIAWAIDQNLPDDSRN